MIDMTPIVIGNPCKIIFISDLSPNLRLDADGQKPRPLVRRAVMCAKSFWGKR
jgi:hypothetical protein